MSSLSVGRTSPPPEQNDTFLDTGLGNMAARATLLALFIIIGFVGNCVLVATIAQSQRLKVFKLNLFILSVAIVNLINCIVNMPLILGNAITEKWDYGDFVCRFNAFTIQLASIAMIFGLLFMTLERFLAVLSNDIEKYSSLISPLRCNILIVYSWLHAFGFSVPLIFGIIPVKAFSARYLCAIDSGTSVVYLCIHSVLCYLIPISIIISLFMYIIITSFRERMRFKSRTSTYSDIPKRLSEVNTSKYVGVVFLFWSICEGPYLLITAVEQYKNSSLIRDANINLDFEYPWQVELTVTWLKLSNAIVLPIVTLFWRKEVWHKFKNCVLCRKSNHIVDASPKKSRWKKNEEKNKKPQDQDKVEMNSKGSFTVPVLFATPEGLHFQTFNKKDVSESKHSTDSEKGFNSSPGESTAIATKCDVYGSQNFLDLDDGDTSCYDSEIDPFSGSNPISVHTRGSQENSHSTFIGLDCDEKESCEAKLDDSGYEFSVNSKERDKTSSKKKKNDENQQNQEEVDQAIYDDKNDRDSGRGSYGENSLKKNKKKKRKEYIDDVNNVPPQNQKIVETAQEEFNPKDSLPKKKKNIKKKPKSNIGVENPSIVNDFVEHGPMPQLKRPAPARLNPLLNKDEYLEKLSNARESLNQNELQLAPPRPLPVLPEHSTKILCSDQPKSSSNDVRRPNKDFTRSQSDDQSRGETPTPAPRKPRVKACVLEEDVPIEKPLRRKERRRTTSQSTTDSQTQLLGNSDGFLEVIDQSDVNKHKKDVATGTTSPTLDYLPKLKKPKKKSQALDSKKLENQ